MCCSDYDDCDFDILMMVLRCFAEPKKKFVARVIIGILFDGIEGLSIEFKEIDDNINIYLIGLTAVLYVILCICIVVKYRRGKDPEVYKFNYVISFKVISLVVAFIIFYTTSNFDWNTIEQLYNHLADSNFTDIFLTAINIVSFLDIVLNSFSLIFLIWKIHKAVKEGKGTYCKVLFKKFDFSSASEDGSATGQNNKAYSTETPNSSNEAK